MSPCPADRRSDGRRQISQTNKITLPTLHCSRAGSPNLGNRDILSTGKKNFVVHLDTPDMM
jgi:hypothetical protein